MHIHIKSLKNILHNIYTYRLKKVVRSHEPFGDFLGAPVVIAKLDKILLLQAFKSISKLLDFQ